MGLCTIRVSTDPELPQVKGGQLRTVGHSAATPSGNALKGCSAPRPEENALTIRSDRLKNDGKQSQRDRWKASCK